jgi:hypothetical protein
MNRAILVIFGLSLIFAACTQRMVCPAYQSAFIYDKDQLRKKFSYFQEDSTPKVLTASKNKYLIAEAMPYRKKIQRMQTVPMKKVFVQVPDSISGVESDTVITAELDAAARSVIDSTFIPDLPQEDTVASAEDSIYVISKDREIRILKYNSSDSLEYDSINQRYISQTPAYYVEEVGFNTEQDNYMWYLRHNLVLPDVRLAKIQANGGGPAGSGKDGKKVKEKKGFFGFFKNLFKKKKQEPVDSSMLDPGPPPDEFDYVDTTATEEPDTQVRPIAQEKKGLFRKKKEEPETAMQADGSAADKPSKKKKKKKADKKKEEPVVEEETKEEEDDDGF